MRSQPPSTGVHTRLARATLRLLIVLLAGTFGSVSARTAPGAAITYVCTMHADVLEEHPGRCPVCGMALQPVRIEAIWSCPFHATVMQEKAGICRFDGRPLVQMTVNHYWTCRDVPQTYSAGPGPCDDGSRRREQRIVRAHGDHNPRHGGQFFMASDLWHHLEGTYPQPSLFRLYVYDNFMRPLDARGTTGRAIVQGASGERLATLALSPSQDGLTLEADMRGQSAPLRIRAEVKLPGTNTEEHLDFSFPSLTADTRTTSNQPASGGGAPARIAEPSVSAVRTPSPAGMLAGAASPAELLTVLPIRLREVRTLIDQGNLGSVYVPVMIAKDLALSLAAQADALPAPQRGRVLSAASRVVRAAWRMDRLGDLGDRDGLLGEYAELSEAVTALRTSYVAR